MSDSEMKTEKPLERSRGLFINRNVNDAAALCRAAREKAPDNAGPIIRLVRCLQVGAEIKEADLLGTSFEGVAVNQVKRLQLTIDLCREALRLAPHTHKPAITERLVKLENQSANERLIALAQQRHRAQSELPAGRVDSPTEFKSWREDNIPPTQFYPVISGKIKTKP